MTLPRTADGDREVHVYVDTNVLRYFDEAISDPSPPAERSGDTATAADQVAATRLFMYARARGWRLWVSGTARAELQNRDGPLGRDDWTIPVFEDLDERSDAPPAELVEETAERYRGEFGLSERRRPDMLHLARVMLLPQLGVFVTNDRKLAGWTHRALDLAAPGRTVRIYTPAEAERALELQPGEPPAVGLGRGHPLLSAPSRWWIPEEEETGRR